eukprot:356244-Chlamydomonas_euryale.AAC.8
MGERRVEGQPGRWKKQFGRWHCISRPQRQGVCKQRYKPYYKREGRIFMTAATPPNLSFLVDAISMAHTLYQSGP